MKAEGWSEVVVQIFNQSFANDLVLSLNVSSFSESIPDFLTPEPEASKFVPSFKVLSDLVQVLKVAKILLTKLNGGPNSGNLLVREGFQDHVRRLKSPCVGRGQEEDLEVVGVDLRPLRLALGIVELCVSQQLQHVLPGLLPLLPSFFGKRDPVIWHCAVGFGVHVALGLAMAVTSKDQLVRR